MADLVTIAKQVSTDLGRPELVTAFGTDYTPTDKFRRIINAANKRLERMVDYEAEFRRISLPVATGDYFLNVPKEIQYIDSIDIEDSTTRYPVNPRSDLYMRENYAEPFSLVDTGRPVDWARWTPSGVRFENLVENGDFTVNTNNWTADTGTLTSVSGKARLTSSGSGGAIFQEFDPEISLRGHRLNARITPSAGVTEYWVSIWNGVTNIILYPTNTDGLIDLDSKMQYLVEQGLYTQAQVDTVMDGCDRIVFAMIGGGATYIDIDGVSITTAQSSPGNLLILPPADAAYTLYIRARVYADDMVANNDTTFFSNRHPDLLVTMVKRQIAVEINRNETERQEYDNELAVQLFEIEKATAAEEQAGGILSTRMGYNQ